MTVSTLHDMEGPFTPVPEGEGYGYLGVVLYDDVQDRVQCHCCGKWFKAVTWGHVLRCSGRSVADHKDAYGLARSTAICRPGTSEIHRALLAESVARGQIHLFEKDSEYQRSCLAQVWESRRKIRGGKCSMEGRNKAGTSPAQIRARLLHAIAINGGQPPLAKGLPAGLLGMITTHCGGYGRILRELGFEGKWFTSTDEELLDALREMERELGRSVSLKDCGGRWPGATTFIRRFGSWTRAKKLAGCKPSRRIQYSDDELLAMLQSFKEEHGRSPVAGDFEGKRPHVSTFKDHFGSWSNALKLAFEAGGSREVRGPEEPGLKNIKELRRIWDEEARRLPTAEENGGKALEAHRAKRMKFEMEDYTAKREKRLKKRRAKRAAEKVALAKMTRKEDK